MRPFERVAGLIALHVSPASLQCMRDGPDHGGLPIRDDYELRARNAMPMLSTTPTFLVPYRADGERGCSNVMLWSSSRRRGLSAESQVSERSRAPDPG